MPYDIYHDKAVFHFLILLVARKIVFVKCDKFSGSFKASKGCLLKSMITTENNLIDHTTIQQCITQILMDIVLKDAKLCIFIEGMKLPLIIFSVSTEAEVERTRLW